MVLSRIIFFRHGKNVSYNWDSGLTDEGVAQARQAAMRLVETLGRDTAVTLYCGPSARTTETARLFHQLLVEHLGKLSSPPIPCADLADPWLLVDGVRRLPTEVYREIRQAYENGVMSPEQAKFFETFWECDDPIGYLLNSYSTFAENREQVLKRLLQFFQRVARENRDGLTVAVTHSGPLRTLLEYAMGKDVPVPAYCESVALEVEKDAPLTLRLTYQGRTLRLEFPRASDAMPAQVPLK